MKITNIHSPNYNSKKRLNNSIKFIIIHYTGMQSERESIKRLCNPKHNVSSHYLINKKGSVFRLVKDLHVAWHAGISCWDKYKNLNKNSIGVELVNKGHEFGYKNFKKKQIINLITLCRYLIKKYKIKKKYILGHSDIAPLRKIDPGERFPWKEFADNKISIWHNLKPNLLKNYRKIKIKNKADRIKFFKNLKKIGYCFSIKKKLTLIKVIKAFQRHFRKELIDGILDKECLLIAENLSKTYKNC